MSPNDCGCVHGMNLDRIIGAVLIILGLYLVLWGKSEERKMASEVSAAGSGSDHVNRAAPKSALVQPLLPPSSSENAV